jgi:hypothetical protein
MGQDDKENMVETVSADFQLCLAKEFKEMWNEVSSMIKIDDELKTIVQVHDEKDLQKLLEKVRGNVKESKAGCGRAQRISVAMSRVLDNYTGIGDIVKSLNMTTAHAGPLAYGIFAILLKVS